MSGDCGLSLLATDSEMPWMYDNDFQMVDDEFSIWLGIVIEPFGGRYPLL